MLRCAVILLLVAGTFTVLSARSAHAGTCGDYLQMDHHPQHSHPAPQHSETSQDQLTLGAPIPEGIPTPSPAPCNGPRCSRSKLPLTPTPPSAPETIDSNKQLVALLETPPDVDSMIVRAGWSAASLYEFEQRCDIFHPPRAL